MPMMTSQILKSVDFTKTQKSTKSRERSIIFYLKKSLITHQGLIYDKK